MIDFRVRISSAACLLASLLALAGCGGSADDSSPRLSEADRQAFTEQVDAVKSWNAAAIQWVAALRDRNRFLQVKGPYTKAMGRSVHAIRRAAGRARNGRLRSFLVRIAEIYRAEYALVRKVNLAAERGDSTSLRGTAARLQELTKRKDRIADQISSTFADLGSAPQ
jgi:hypothetical protein